MNRLFIFSLVLLASCGSNETHNTIEQVATPPAGNPKIVSTWIGYQNNNIIKTINIDTDFKVDSVSARNILFYAKTNHFQSKSNQNVYLYFYTGNAPEKIPFAENIEGTLDGAMNFIKASSPVLTVSIIGEREFFYYFGFAG